MLIGTAEDIFRLSHDIPHLPQVLGLEAVIINSKVSLSDEIFQEALDFLYERHPLLRMRIVKLNGKYCFTPMLYKKTVFQVRCLLYLQDVYSTIINFKICCMKNN